MKELTKKVRAILEEYPDARDDDMVLYMRMCRAYNQIASGMPFAHVLANHAELGLYNYESVGRARRKLQETYPELRGSRQATDARCKRWKEMREYAESEV